MRIAIITTDARYTLHETGQEYPNFGTAIRSLLQGFANHPEAEIHVISSSPAVMKSPEKLAGNIWFHQPVVSKIGWGRTFFQGCIRATRKVLRKIQPDIVHGQGTERDCAMAAVHSGFPNVLTIHGNMKVHAAMTRGRGAIYYQLAARLEKHALLRTGGVVAISRYTEDLVKDLAPRTWLLPNAADARYFDVRPEGPAVCRILFVGAICERKNPIGLIEACEPLLRQGECTIAFAGHGSEADPYWGRFQTLLDQVPGLELLGFVDQDTLARELGRSSLLVLPTFEDNCPMVVLEGMAAGLPVAASWVGGVPDLIAHDKDGILFDPLSPGEVRSHLESLVRHPGLRKRLGAEARRTAAEKFHPDFIAAEHLRIYQEVLRS